MILDTATPHDEQLQWTWKDAISDVVHMDAENLQLPGSFQSQEEVESYMKYLASFVQELMHQHGQ